jgi:hypothetical protein
VMSSDCIGRADNSRMHSEMLALIFAAPLA